MPVFPLPCLLSLIRWPSCYSSVSHRTREIEFVFPIGQGELTKFRLTGGESYLPDHRPDANKRPESETLTCEKAEAALGLFSIWVFTSQRF